MAITKYTKYGKTGGGVDDLDGVNGDNLLDGDPAHVWEDGILYHYLLDATSGATATSPTVIAPVTNPGDKRWILQGISVGGDVDFNGYYSTGQQNIPDLAAKGSAYSFDGVSGEVLVPANVSMADIFDGGGSVVYLAYPFSDGESSAGRLYDKAQGNTGSALFLQNDDGSDTQIKFFATFSSDNGSWLTTNRVLPLFQWSWVIVTYDSDSVANDPIIYVNGKSVAITEDVTPVGTRVSDAATDLYIGNRSGNDSTWHGSISVVRHFNRILTADEAKAQSSGAPIASADIGASQTALNVSNCVNTPGHLYSTFANETPTGFDAISNGAALHAASTADEIVVVLDIRYRIRFFLVLNSGTAPTFNLYVDPDNLNTVVGAPTTVSSPGLNTLEFTCTVGATAGLSFSNNSTVTNYEVTNIAVTQIGCALQLEQPGIGHGQLIDISGNEMHGTVSGALPINLPPDHTELYVDLTLTGNSSYTLPKGYEIVSVIVAETSGNALTGGLDSGLSANAAEVISGMPVGANATVNCTLVATGVLGGTHIISDDEIFFSDGDDDGNWNGAQLQARVTMKRRTVN